VKTPEEQMEAQKKMKQELLEAKEAKRRRIFFPALPSEHGAWSVNSRDMRLQKV